MKTSFGERVLKWCMLVSWAVSGLAGLAFGPVVWDALHGREPWSMVLFITAIMLNPFLLLVAWAICIMMPRAIWDTFRKSRGSRGTP